jgi:hypothetical protein
MLQKAYIGALNDGRLGNNFGLIVANHLGFLQLETPREWRGTGKPNSTPTAAAPSLVSNLLRHSIFITIVLY